MQVLDTLKDPTGKWEIRPTIFGPRIYVEMRHLTWDTNTGQDERTRMVWRKAVNSEIRDLLVVLPG